MKNLIVSKISSDGGGRSTVHRSEIPFTDEEKAIVLGDYGGEQFTLGDFFDVSTSRKLKTLMDGLDYIKFEKGFNQSYFKSFGKKEYQEKLAIATKAHDVLADIIERGHNS